MTEVTCRKGARLRGTERETAVTSRLPAHSSWGRDMRRWTVTLGITCAALLCAFPRAAPQRSGGIYVPSQVPGTWVADLSRSKLGPNSPFSSITLEITPAGDTVKLTSTLMTASGQTRTVAETFPTDGTETPGTLSPGVTVRARWVGPYVLATNASKEGNPFVRVIYQASADGQTLTSRSSGASDEIVVYTRK
jgi:hypothetical protein